MNTSTPPALLAYCRAGFEPDLAAELAAAGGKPALTLAVPETGYVVAPMSKPRAPKDLVFARQSLLSTMESIPLGSRDRLTPIVDGAREFLARYAPRALSSVWLEYPDTNDGKALSKLAQVLEPRVAKALSETVPIEDNPSHPRLHVFMTPDQQARVALSQPGTSSNWRNGIPRLRMPHDAPSRSTLKLAEAIHVFLGERDERLLQPGMHAVDLGAAPGGWTWQLVHRGLHVTAIDNGRLKGELVDNALVRHLREDGFRYRPRRPVDWMVCDMVERPVRIAQLVASWFADGLVERAIFNLKLPMKKRHEEVMRCRDIIETAVRAHGRQYELRFKQLYHDREEVTGFCRFIPRSERR